MQAAAEGLYGLIDGVLVGPIIGHNGKPYIPFVFTIFMLVFTMNFLGVTCCRSATWVAKEWTFTATAQLAVTATLALITFLSVLAIGVMEERLQESTWPGRPCPA